MLAQDEKADDQRDHDRRALPRQHRSRRRVVDAVRCVVMFCFHEKTPFSFAKLHARVRLPFRGCRNGAFYSSGHHLADWGNSQNPISVVKVDALCSR